MLQAVRQGVKRGVAQQAKLFLGALVIGALAGCAPNLPPPKQQSQAPAPAPTPQYQEVPAAPVDTSTKIGLMLPLSGPQAALGRELYSAAEMGLFEVGDERFTLLVEDTAAGADSAARKLLAQGAKVLLGPVFATDVRKVAPIAQGAHVPVLAFTNDQSAAQPGVYIMGVTPQDQVDRVVSYAASQGMKRFAILAPTSPYGNIVTQSFREAVVNSNGILAQMSLYDPNSPDYTGVVEQLATFYQDNPFDALMLPEGGAKLRQLAPLLPAFQLDTQTVQVLGTGLWANDATLAQETGLTGAWFASTEPQRWQDFAERYYGIYGTKPDQRTGLVYDAITLVVALGKAPVPDYSEAALTNVDGFSGVNGVFRLNADGTVDRQLAVMEVAPGGATERDSAAGSFASLIN